MAHVLKQRNVSDKSGEMHVQLYRQVLVDGLRWFRLSQVTEESVNFIWQALDSMAGCGGPPHFVEFMRLVFGDMTDCQRALVIKAFTKMDSAMTGQISLNELRRFYTAPGWAVKEFGPSVIPSPGEFQELIRIATGSPEYPVEFFEFEVLYHGLTIALGDSPVDCITDESQWTRLVVDWQGYQSDGRNQFERILRDQWSM